MGATKIIEKLPTEQYLDWVQTRSIKINPHALFRLSDAQRKVFKEEELIKTMKNETPCLVGLQKNGNYATFSRRNKEYRRIVFTLDEKTIEVVTFYDTDTLPQLTK
ncbi:hypothetical protein HY489_02290 [Candidatus Woesearchaeota archaeon]|nr:hypothetical protein [Candidatus Woesearchaeota archaeon]